MHSTAGSVHLPNKPAATPCNSLPRPPTQRGAGGTDNNFGRHRPLKRIELGAVARFKHGYNVISADRVAWSTRDASRPKKSKAKRSLGQNFLQREEVLVSIVKAAGVSPGDRVLEIGPGTGALTRHLLRAGASLTAVEKDDALHAQLQQDFDQVCTNVFRGLALTALLCMTASWAHVQMQHQADALLSMSAGDTRWSTHAGAQRLSERGCHSTTSCACANTCYTDGAHPANCAACIVGDDRTRRLCRMLCNRRPTTMQQVPAEAVPRWWPICRTT